VQEGVPLFVLESNINPGKTNARLAPKAAAVVLAFEESVQQYPASLRSKLHVLGNPVRTQIDASRDTASARASFGLDPQRPTVLVFGGSLGARTINDAISSALSMFETEPYQVLWQTGANYTAPSLVPSNVHVVPFIADMGAAYAAADLVVARSGATTIAELGIVGKPAIFVPLPSASTDEQRRNAAAVERAGGALVLDDARASAELATTIRTLMLDVEQRRTMATAMLRIGHPQAAANTAALILATCGVGASL
jgi:UDP-N-acetylglucosamine--N-acetylmuramyl-(pentapeptide) pyrophosphoryl-undecaprenol N-acetylglucosamine transferase